MGRTVLSARWQLDREIGELSRFRDALRKEDRDVFDGMVLAARKHVSAISYAANIDMMESVILAILLEQEKRILERERRVERVEKALREKSPS